MQTIDTQLKLIEYLGENPLNISNLPGLFNLKKLGTFFSNSVITWVQGDPPMFQGFSSLLRESGYYVLSQGSLPYTLHNEIEIIPSPKNVVSRLQIVSWKCDNKLIADMDSSFFNGVAKIGKLNNNSFTTWQPGIPDMFQGFLSFEKDETYLILSNPSGLPYQLYQCDPCAYEVCKDFYDWWMAGMTLNFSWDMGTTLWNDKPHAGTRWSGTASEVKPAGQQNFSLFRTATINTVDFLLRIDINVFINNGKYYFNYNEYAQGVPPNQEFVDGIRMMGGNDICDSGFNWNSFNVFGYNFYWYPMTDMDGYITTTPSIAPPVCTITDPCRDCPPFYADLTFSLSGPYLVGGAPIHQYDPVTYPPLTTPELPLRLCSDTFDAGPLPEAYYANITRNMNCGWDLSVTLTIPFANICGYTCQITNSTGYVTINKTDPRGTYDVTIPDTAGCCESGEGFVYTITIS